MDRWRILVVDDNQDTLDLIRMSLEEEYDVLTLDNPIQTPDILTVFEPDLVVLDVMMPKVSGFQLIEYMKKSKDFKDIPVVFLTAKGAISDQKYGYTLGASLYLTKPFQPSRLLKNIKLMFQNMAEQRKPKKYSMREVELRLSLQATYKRSTQEPAINDAGKTEGAKAKADETTKKNLWLD
ncbi:MAG: Response regulator SaeR [candidate division BRC1 bacterium ADurb.BinA364]|nr:MAG: Response regulator SaeR [candidate division BRC1 bacterium ADurb.BinA364]